MSPTHSVALASKGKSKASVLPPSRLPVLHSRSTSLEKRITDDALKPISKSSLPGHGPGKPGPSSFPAASKLLTMTAPTLATLTTSPITVTAFTAASTHDNERNLTPPIHPSENADEPSLEESNIRMLRLGMERGYTLSPMAHLWLELLKVVKQTTSTSARCLSLATKTTLKPKEVIDQGPEFERLGHFRIRDKLSNTVCQTVGELQTFTQQMAAFIPERSHFFIVDPDDTLLEVLGGAESTGQLLAAWRALSNRIERAQRFMLKYRDEYTDSVSIASPASTN
ncbi:hypothetical protein M413DRAFT_28267 [Hebeloma cylindrosporum]|uniref:Uncharacterized protein n=1 Tax=Hebeloma cylindrosporum TaxID=76867 RepID=A0A0C3C881_HEBCY|nr:hypothetical protein M413DRAFT_28267 [Hebeloma cylindrosporum h7]